MSGGHTDADRLMALEERLAYLDRHVETLDELVQELFGERDRLQRELRRLEHRVDANTRSPEDPSTETDTIGE